MVVHESLVRVGLDLRTREEGRQVVANAGMAVKCHDEEDARDVGDLRGAEHVDLARERDRRVAETENAVRAGDVVGDHGILLIDEQEIARGERHGTETQRAARRHHQRPGGG